jgi:hypothetical protein
VEKQQKEIMALKKTKEKVEKEIQCVRRWAIKHEYTDCPVLKPDADRKHAGNTVPLQELGVIQHVAHERGFQ